MISCEIQLPSFVSFIVCFSECGRAKFSRIVKNPRDGCLDLFCEQLANARKALAADFIFSAFFFKLYGKLSA